MEDGMYPVLMPVGDKSLFVFPSARHFERCSNPANFLFNGYRQTSQG